jgi:hypothetical protein
MVANYETEAEEPDEEEGWINFAIQAGAAILPWAIDKATSFFSSPAATPSDPVPIPVDGEDTEEEGRKRRGGFGRMFKRLDPIQRHISILKKLTGHKRHHTASRPAPSEADVIQAQLQSQALPAMQQPGSMPGYTYSPSAPASVAPAGGGGGFAQLDSALFGPTPQGSQFSTPFAPPQQQYYPNSQPQPLYQQPDQFQQPQQYQQPPQYYQQPPPQQYFQPQSQFSGPPRDTRSMLDNALFGPPQDFVPAAQSPQLPNPVEPDRPKAWTDVRVPMVTDMLTEAGCGDDGACKPCATKARREQGSATDYRREVGQIIDDRVYSF